MQEAHYPGPVASPGEEVEGGLGPTVALVVMSLTTAAVGVYQLCGFGLHILNPRPHLFNGFATAGVIAATVAAGAAIGNLAWLLTASRRRAAALGGGCDSAGGGTDPTPTSGE
ncbi:hypothetical protein ACNPQM_21725 [Streptomyces sp. NPDC056231]|uniref:hypothetical protein n=1 Tax=Streptomyces sp. NPDC056231 TaxID=3345755 RepID=UPI003AAB7AF7